MSRTTRTADGDLLTELSPADRNAYLQPRGGAPREGTNVRLWRLPGTWHVWSPGPDTGTWWLRAIDETAREAAHLLGETPSRGEPVVKATWKDCVAVRSREIRTH